MNFNKFLKIVSCILFALPTRAQNTFEFKSMVILNKIPKKGFVLNVNGQKAETDQGGIFGIGLHNNITYVLVKLEDQAYSILYPPDGHLPVPKNLTEIPIIYLGTKEDSRRLGELISLTKKIDALTLSETEKRRDLSEQINNLKLLLENKFQTGDLERTTFQQKRLEEDKDRSSVDILNSLNSFCERASVLNETLKNSIPAHYSKSQQSMQLYEKVFEYNYAYHELISKRSNYEKNIDNYWLNDSLKIEFNALMSFTIDTANKKIIDSFNPNLNEIKSYCCCDKKRDQNLEQNIKKRIDVSVALVELVINDLNNRVNHFKYTLKNNSQ